METIKSLNLALRFFLELAALAAFAFWGWSISDNLLLQVVLAFALPLLGAAVWGKFVAPASPTRLPNLPRLGLEVVIFALAVIALMAAGEAAWGLILAFFVAMNLAFLTLWDQR